MLHAEAATDIAQALSERKSTHMEAQVAVYRTNIDRYTEQNAELTQRITANLQRMRNERDCLNIAKQAAEDRSFAEHLTDEWAQLCQHKRLADASIEGDQLTLTTTDDIRLHCEDRTDTRWLGAFEIILDLGDGSITLNNLNTRRGGRDHPHVINGKPCFGGDAHVFAQLLSDGSLNVLYEMILQYLEKCNLEDEYGAYAAFWFEREDERPPEQTIELEVAA